MNYITAGEAGERWGISPRRVCILCKEGRIPGAVKKSRVWILPENAQKPDDGRKNNPSGSIEPILLLYNPTYFDNRPDCSNEDDRHICEVQKKYLTGNLEEACYEVERYISFCTDDNYRLVYYIIKYYLCADLGKKEELLRSREKIEDLCAGSSVSPLGKAIVDYYLGSSIFFDRRLVGDELFDEVLPLVGMIAVKKSINALILQSGEGDPTCIEIICKELKKRDCPLITAYCCLFMVIYYNVLGDRASFEEYIDRALAILLPRKWYTPIAEYSATVDLKELKQLSEEERKAIYSLFERIVGGYVSAGILDGLAGAPMKNAQRNVQVAFKLAQGKSVDVISGELGISQYKVKQHIEDLYSVIGVDSKKGIKSFVIKNIFV